MRKKIIYAVSITTISLGPEPIPTQKFRFKSLKTAVICCNNFMNSETTNIIYVHLMECECFGPYAVNTLFHGKNLKCYDL